MNEKLCDCKSKENFNDNICVWEEIKASTYKTECKDKLYYNRDYDNNFDFPFKYCPFCSKMIEFNS
jgi:hypothetical protein